MDRTIKSIIAGAEKAAQERHTINEDDYINSDGLWVCGKCNTPKQVKIELCGEILTPMCLCECEGKRFENDKKELQRALYIDHLRAEAFSDQRMLEWTFDNDDKADPKTIDIAKRYAEKFKEMNGKGLILFGDVGTGKSYAAACIVNELIQKRIPCKMTNFARIINELSSGFEGRQEYIDNFNRYDLLVIDDLAAERDTEYMSENVYNIIDARYRSGKALIVTTNLTADELKNAEEVRKQRIYSRLLEMCMPIEVKGKDRRKTKLKEDLSKYKELLGI